MKTKIATSIYKPVNKPKGIVLIIHGMAEHRKRYDEFARFLSDNDLVCVTYDQIGHGETATDKNELGYFGEKEGFDSLVHYSYKLAIEAKNEFKDIPLIVLGHSMGSIVARLLLQKYPDVMDCLILSGPPYYQDFAKVGLMIANIICKVQGNKNTSKILKNLIGNYDKADKSYKVKNEWLSYNLENVEKYNNDELCGFTFTNKGYHDLLTGLIQMHDVSKYVQENNQKPILVFAGCDDPVIGKETGINISVSDLKNAGYENIEVKLYENTRHEALLDNKKEEVSKDILTWIIKNI